MVIKLLLERISERREPAHLHPHGEVLTLGKRRADVLPVRPALHRRLERPDAL